MEYDVNTSSETGKVSAANVTGPNGAQVKGAPRIRNDENQGANYQRFSDRGDSPKRHSSGPKSYPKQPYSESTTTTA